jgi:hypothetical protein
LWESNLHVLSKMPLVGIFGFPQAAKMTLHIQRKPHMPERPNYTLYVTCGDTYGSFGITKAATAMPSHKGRF